MNTIKETTFSLLAITIGMVTCFGGCLPTSSRPDPVTVVVSIEGKVVHGENKDAIPGARVTLEKLEGGDCFLCGRYVEVDSTVTDTNGFYHITKRISGCVDHLFHHLNAEKKGFGTSWPTSFECMEETQVIDIELR